MTDATTTVDTYLAAWNETDTAKRARLIERAWVGDGRYSDPMLEAPSAPEPEQYEELGLRFVGVPEKR